MPTTWKIVRVFISSTFRDMQAERDHLVRFVFSKLREELLKRRIHFVDVDLRWGVTSEQDASAVCREVVDECRPRFLCMLGGRYGWIPPGKDKSITADEVHYGVLDRELSKRGFAYFYFRDLIATATMEEKQSGEFREPPGSPNEQKLIELKNAIEEHGLKPFAYRARWDAQSRRLIGLTEFGERVYTDLIASIEDELGTESTAKLDEFAEENAAMESFVEERTQRFVLGSRNTVWNELLQHAEGSGGNGYLCLIGEPGCGKSALLAKFSRDLVEKVSATGHSTLVSHFVGASPNSTDRRHTLRRLCHELIKGTSLTAEIPDDPEKLSKAFPEILKQACVKARVVLLLDAINQFDPGSSELSWLPEELPDNARIIVTTLAGPALDDLHLRRVPPREVTLPPLSPSDADAIINGFLNRYRKSMTPEQKAMLRVKADAGTPLYLLAALEEVRTLGTYEEIAKRIRELPETTQALFMWILQQRLESDPGFRDEEGRLVGHELVSRFAALLSASQHGLSQGELADLLAPGGVKAVPPIEPDPQGNVAALLQLLRPYLMRRGELLDFYHGQFRAAAEQAYLQTNAQRRSAHETLAGYFRSQADPDNDQHWKGENARPFVELPYHLERSDAGKLQELLWNPRWYRAKLKHTDAYGLIQDLAMAPKDHDLRLVEDAIYLSVNVLMKDRSQLANQLVGRLFSFTEPRLKSLVQNIVNSQDDIWLRSLSTTLTLPGGYLLRSLEGHTGDIDGVAIDSAGRLAFSSSNDSTLKVWDLQTGKVLRTLKVRTYDDRGSYGVAVDSAGRLAVIASDDRTYKVWDLQTGKALHTFEGGSAYATRKPYGVAVDSAGRLAVTASWDDTLKVWDLQSGKELHTLKGHTQSVIGIAVDSAGRLAVTASWDRTLKVWDLQTGKELRTLEGHTDSVNGVSVDSAGRLAVSASDDKTLKVWDLQTGKELRSLEGHTGHVNGVSVDSAGRLAVSASADKTLKVWDLQTGKELRTLEGHLHSVNSVSVDSAGRLAVSASADKTLKVWDLQPGKELPIPKGHTGRVNGVSVDSAGRLAVSASADHTLKVWDLQTGKEKRTLEGHADWVNGVSVDSAGRLAVSESADHTLKVWDLQTGKELRTIKGYSYGSGGVSVDSAGRLIVSASDNHTLKVWDLQTGKELRTGKDIVERNTPDGHVAIDSTGRLAVYATDYVARVWDLQTGKVLHILRGHTRDINGVSVDSAGCLAVSASADKTLKVWDLKSGKEIHTLTGHTWPVQGVSVDSAGHLAVSASDDKTLKVWDLQTGKELANFIGEGFFTCCAFTGDGKTIIAGDDSGAVHFLKLVLPEEAENTNAGVCRQHQTREFSLQEDSVAAIQQAFSHPDNTSPYRKAAKSARPLQNRVNKPQCVSSCIQALKGHALRVTSCAYSPDGRRIVSASEDNTLKVWDAETGEERFTLEGHTGVVTSCAYSSDGRRIVSASWDNTLKVWDVETGHELFTLKGHRHWVLSCAYSPDSRRIVSASWDNTLKVWDAETGEEGFTLKGHTSVVFSCAYSPNGRRIVSASEDNTLKVWDAETGEEGFTLKGHTKRLSSCAYSPDGRRIVSASWDNTIKVWDAETGEERITLKGHTDVVNSCAYSPDGRRIVSASYDNTLKVWDAETGEELSCFNGAYSMNTVACTTGSVTAGDEQGTVYILKLPVGEEKEPYSTPLRLYRFDRTAWDDHLTAKCEWCGKGFEPDNKIIDAIKGLNSNLSLSQNPAASLPPDAWDDPRLLSDCPICHKPLRFNPFIVDNAKAEVRSQNSESRRTEIEYMIQDSEVRSAEIEEQPEQSIQETEDKTVDKQKKPWWKFWGR